MRLLDQVAQSRSRLLIALPGDPSRTVALPGPAAYAADVIACPHRFVLGDDLTRASATLAFAQGDRLAGCLDLIRIPAPLLWIEWNDAIHKQVLYESGSSANPDPGAAGRQVGVLLRATGCGRTGLARTFWSDPSSVGTQEVVLSPIETHLDLNGDFAPCNTAVPALLHGEFAAIADATDAGVSALLDCVRFRFDEQWASYDRAAARTPDQQRTAVHDSLAAVARDAPLLLAFFLLLNAREATRSVAISRSAINRKRLHCARAPLLDHIEVLSTIDSIRTTIHPTEEIGARRPIRLHHVRGHLMRRANRVFWRTPHLRGRALAGLVRSRTVCLSFKHGPSADEEAGK